MRGCLADQSGDLDRGFATAVEVAIARRQGGVTQVEGLPVLLETPFVQRRSVEPRLTRFGWTRAEVDLGPAGNGRRARDISRSVVHERYQVGPRGLGAPRCTQGRDVPVGKISRKIGRQILEPGAQAEARIGLAPGGRGGNQEKRVQHGARRSPDPGSHVTRPKPCFADTTHGSNYLSCNCQGAQPARNPQRPRSLRRRRVAKRATQMLGEQGTQRYAATGCRCTQYLRILYATLPLAPTPARVLHGGMDHGAKIEDSNRRQTHTPETGKIVETNHRQVAKAHEHQRSRAEAD